VAPVDEGYFDDYVTRVDATISAAETGKLHANKSTENSRLLVSLASLGIDATNFGGKDLVVPLFDTTWVQRQGINGPIWALIALDSKPYYPDDSSARDFFISYILDRDVDSGGWALFGTSGDPDITAMALYALAPYYDRGNEVLDDAVDKALGFLSSAQAANGGYSSWGSINAESCAQVVIALSALGIDAAADARFVKAEGNVLSALLAFQNENGGFAHTVPGASNGMASEQAAEALVAYDRYVKGRSPLFDMSDAGWPGDEVDEGTDEGTDDESDDEGDEGDEGDGEVGEGSDSGSDGESGNGGGNSGGNTTSGSGRPTNDYHPTGTDGTNASGNSRPSTTTGADDTKVADASAASGGAANTDSSSVAPAVKDAETPLVAQAESVIPLDEDSPSSSGIFVFARALVGIIFGLAAVALIVLLIVRFTARKKGDISV
ncbi:MAG: terpene cyclase/mutase family protein, partial [Coriobacteriales bacterium]|jgi:hypothetical protein|nr:terpene cyclase/mutase family protein [Coriobacteriales bacterium]